MEAGNADVCLLPLQALHGVEHLALQVKFPSSVASTYLLKTMLSIVASTFF